GLRAAMPMLRGDGVGTTRTEVGRRAGSKAEAITVLMLEVAQCFFKIRALGQKAGFITSWGGGAFGFMRSLALLGPLTVPQIAQMRPTGRQRMRRLANELSAEGLVEFIDNLASWYLASSMAAGAVIPLRLASTSWQLPAPDDLHRRHPSGRQDRSKRT